jgi:hypothetical protein
MWSHHQVQNFVSMAGVQMGQYGLNQWISDHFPGTMCGSPLAANDELCYPTTQA